MYFNLNGFAYKAAASKVFAYISHGSSSLTELFSHALHLFLLFFSEKSAEKYHLLADLKHQHDLKNKMCHKYGAMKKMTHVLQQKHK